MLSLYLLFVFSFLSAIEAYDDSWYDAKGGNSIQSRYNPENLTIKNNDLLDGSHDGENFTDIHIWAISGQNQRMKQLIENSSQVIITEETNYGNSPLHLASEFGHTNLVKMLVNHFGNESSSTRHSYVIKKNNQRRNALHLASINSHLETVRILRKEDVNGDLVDAQDMFNQTALDYALRRLRQVSDVTKRMWIRSGKDESKQSTASNSTSNE